MSIESVPKFTKTPDQKNEVATINEINSAEWTDFYNNFKLLRQELLKAIRNSENEEELYNELKLQEKKSFSSVKNPREYITYHVSLGGSTNPQSSPIMDFPDDSSLSTFYQKMIDKINGA